MKMYVMDSNLKKNEIDKWQIVRFLISPNHHVSVYEDKNGQLKIVSNERIVVRPETSNAIVIEVSDD